MENSYLENKVKGIIAESLFVTFDEVTLDANFIDDLGADSLGLLEVLMNIEEAFDIEISDEEVTKIVTVLDLIVVAKQLGRHKRRGRWLN